MSRTLTIMLQLTVADDASDFGIADAVFDTLVDEATPDITGVESVDGTMPRRES